MKPKLRKQSKPLTKTPPRQVGEVIGKSVALKAKSVKPKLRKQSKNSLPKLKRKACLFCDKQFNPPKKSSKFCSMSCRGKWMIKNTKYSLFVKGHKVRVGMKHPLSFIIKRRGEGNPAWKGDSIKQHSLHSWIRDNFETPDKCEHCGKQYPHIRVIFDWSNKNHKYKRNKKDWQFLCRSCHMKYDYKFGLRKPHSTKKHD